MTELAPNKNLSPKIPETYRNNPRHWDWETEGRPINIGSQDPDQKRRILSNFAPTRFILDGIEYTSVEAFIQSLKSPREEERKRIRQLTGVDAKKAGRKYQAEIEEALLSGKSYLITYQDRQISLWSNEWFELVERALRAKFEQKPGAKEALVGRHFDERGKITHVLYNREGRPIAENPATSLPAEVFTTILMKIRHEAQIAHLQKWAEQGDMDYHLHRYFYRSLTNPDIILVQKSGYKNEMKHWLLSVIPKGMKYGSASREERINEAREYQKKACLSDEDLTQAAHEIGLEIRFKRKN